MNPGLTVENIQQRLHSGFEIRCGYSSFESGRISIILGRNGSGKSSFLKMLYGSCKASYRRIFFDGRLVESPLFSLTGAASMLPQDSLFPDYWRISRLSRIPGSGAGFTGWLNEAHPSPGRMKLGDLSGGERRLLELKYLISLNRKYMILDEPLTGLDPKEVKGILTLLQHAGCGVIMTTHRVRDLSGLNADFFIMRDGNLTPYDTQSSPFPFDKAPVLI